MVKLLLFSKKRIIPLLVALCMIVSFCSAPMVSYAKTWTKSSIKKEISAKQKKYNSIKKKYNKEVKKAKNTIALITAEKLSSSPLVCYNDGFLGIGRGYYYIIGGKKNLLTYPSVSGSVKPTGKTKKWGGHTCTVCKGVKLKSSTYKKQMDKLKKQINKLKSAQKYQPSFDEKMSYFEFVGSKFDYNECVYIDDYNKINSWKSSNPSIASISSKGILTPKKVGEVTISAKCSISGKTARQKVKVIEKYQVSDEEGYCYIEYGDVEYIKDDNCTKYVGDSMQLNLKFAKKDTSTKVTYGVYAYDDDGDIDENVATISNTGLIKFNNPGFIRVEIYCDGWHVGNIYLNVEYR